MMMKQLFRQTATLLRTALLLGAMILVNTQTQAQAQLPDAFETMDPASIIGNGEYYYIQFYYGNMRSYLTDCGVEKKALTKDFLPYAHNRLWTLLPAGDGNATHFKLRNKAGNYIGYKRFSDATGDRYGIVSSFADAVILVSNQNKDGYDISRASDLNNVMYRTGAGEWTDLANIGHNNHTYDNGRLRFVKLKNNSAFIIYYRGEGLDNTTAGVDATRHYLTYSGTGNQVPAAGTLRNSAVSSRQSIIPKDKPLPSLPTLAAYHKDGLWTLEETGDDGGFYIKKYESNDYLLNSTDGNNIGILGAKDELGAKYRVEDTGVNRYTPILKYETTPLTADMFKTWNGYGDGATSTGGATVDFNVGNNASLGTQAMVAGTSTVDYLIYADLSDYEKMVINGTQDMQLRVLLSRQESNSGPLVEKNVTIGSDGKAIVDLTNLALNFGSSVTRTGTATVRMTYVNGSDAAVNTSYGEIASGNPAYCGYNKISANTVNLANKDWNVNNIAYLQVDASAINGVITKVTLKGDFQQISAREMKYGVGYNNSTWSPTMTWNTADRSITTLGESQMVTRTTADAQLSFDITSAFTDGKVKTILVYNLAAGAGYIKNPTVEVEYNPSIPYAHLNAIKTGNSGPTGTINSITLLKKASVGSRYLHFSKGDGWQVEQWTNKYNNELWNAGFYPVEVVNEDNFYQVILKNGDQMLGVSGGNAVLKPYSEFNPDLWTLEQFGDYQHYRLRNSEGKYYNGAGNPLLDVAPTSGPGILTNTDLINYNVEWFLKTETVVPHKVTHRMSYLKDYTTPYHDLKLDRQGLTTDAQSDWWNYDSETQKVNHFEITHYVKKGKTIIVPLPTILNASNDHVFYQRWYHYNDETCNNESYPDGTDIEGLKSHVSINSPDDGETQYFLYKNGMVTGQKLDWNGIEQGTTKRNVQRNFYFTNSDGKAFTVAADVSRYSDFTYENESNHLQGDLEEPSLTMRYIYYMRDAKTMAAQLTACAPGSDKWLETKTFHFPARQIFYENQKKAGYRGEFIGLRHLFSDYWVFDGNGTEDENLVSAVNDKSSGKIEVEIVDDATNPTHIRRGGWNPNIDRYGFADGNDADYQGFYFYDMMDFNNVTDAKASYGDSRFIVFRYPASGMVEVPDDPNVKQEAKINVYLNYNGTKYQLAQFTIIFDKGTVTLPYKQINNSSPYVLSDDFKSRDPKALVDKAGQPIAKITFDYPTGDKYHFPGKGTSKQGWWEAPAGATIDNCSPIPLTFDKTNYSFMGFECNWGSYSIVTQMTTNYGNHQNASPANDNTYGYGDANYPALQADQGLQNGFLYIDASEQPGDICSAPFVGDFCAGDKLMFSGWISGANKAGGGDNRCPGGITLTVKGEHMVNGKMQTETLYRFCPGQIYELDNGPGTPDGSGVDGEQWRKNAQGQYIDENGTVVDEDNRVPNPNYDNNKYNVVWQQFYFVFTVSEKYDRHWIEVNNNCVSSKGGDFMLDNVEVYCIVPEVKAEMNTPVCVHKDGSVDMSLLKLTVDYNKLVSSSGVNANTTANLGFVFLDKKVMLKTLIEKGKYSGTLEDLAYEIEEGRFILDGNDDGYKAAFDAALLREPENKKIWKSTDQTANKGAGVMIFQWNSNFNEIEQYSFYKATSANKKPVYRYTDDDGERFLVMNGNFAELPWKLNTDYYIIPANILDPGNFNFNSAYTTFNICSECSKEDVFQIQPPYTILGLEQSDETSDYVVCEGKIPTMLVDLKGYDLNGKQVPMTGLNFDWWLGDKANGVLATLDNYHSQQKNGVELDDALSTMRAYYPDATNLDGIVQNLSKTPNLTLEMTIYLQELIDKGQLILHQTSVSVPAESSSAEDPYFYLVACPIHDANFSQALNPRPGTDYVAFFCDEPQGLRIKLGEKAPKLKSGFVKGENGYDDEYNYAFPEGTDPVLSIRLAKMAQFEQVRHGETTDNPVETYNESAPNTEHFLWLPIRNAEVESSSATGVVRKSRATVEESDDYNVYLASSDDPTWDKAIYKSMSGNNPSLPIVGKIVKLNAVDTKGKTNVDQTSNRLCIYFTTNFDVREGYSYTLSLPFKENAGDNACDGTILINLKIVPDYEVWTGAAGNTDWNNDQNWRRADGNLATSTTESTDGSARNNNELLVSSDLSASSPLKDYTTNYANYRTAKDRIFRKGFAPLYCTHVLIKSNEWGNAPVLYDAIDGNENGLTAKPFPNLRDTSTPILKFDMQAREHSLWPETYGKASNKGRDGDLIAEMYQINSCDEIAFQPGAELLNAHLLNYNSAWVEYQLDTKRWYLLGSPLQGTISGEWYAPTGTAQQKTTYYEPVTFGAGYDRYSPAIYQRSWDKAKAVLYEVGSAYDKDDDKQDANLGNDDEGMWNNAGTTDAPVWQWQSDGTADQYLDRLGYKPFGAKKANVAIKGLWSNTYNDAQVDYATGGFSVMVMNHLKGNDQSGNKAIIRLPKEDTMYDYYKFSETGVDDGGTDTNLTGEQGVQKKDRALNRGRLKTDLLLPEIKDTQEKLIIQKTEKTASRYGDQRSYTRIPIKEADLNTMNGGTFLFTENVAAGASNLGYYLVENPFPCGLDMNAFFAANTGLQKKYWILTKGNDSNPRQQLVQQVPSSEWVSPGTGETNFSVPDAVVAPGQGFFVQATTAGEGTAIIFNKDMQAQTRYGSKDQGTKVTIEVGREPVMVEKQFQVDEDGDGTPETTITESVPDYEADGVTPKTKPITQDVIVYSYKQDTAMPEYNLKTRGSDSDLLGLVITAQRDDSETSALVMQRGEASNDFLPEEDTEVFINSDFENAPTVYTLCGRLATTINSIHDFRSLPIGVESTSDAPCTLTFRGVEMLGDSISFYDAVEQKLTPLESGMSFKVSGQTQNRYYLVRSLNLKDAAEETHLQIFTEGLKAKVIASTAEPITVVRCFDTAGRLICTASPQLPEYSFDLPRAGVYIIEAETEHDRKTMKVVVR